MSKTSFQLLLGKMNLGLFFMFLSCFKIVAADYYVNDNDLSLDVYCTVVGSSGNNGLTPSTPKATLTQILNTYGPSGSNVLTSGDIIYIDAGTYFQTDIQIDITIAGLTIQGAGTTLTLFDNSGHGGTQEYFMRVLANNVNLIGFTVTGYDYDPGGIGKAITVSGATGVVVNGVNTIDNYNNGDAAFMVTSNSEVTFLNGASSCNSGTYGGGYRIEGNTITVLFNNCIVSDNSVSLENGGGIYISGDSGASSNIDITIQNSSIQNNDAVRGGGIFIENADLTVTNSCFDANRGVASNDGGGALYVGDNCVVSLDNCAFTNNTANPSSADGGAISVVAQNTSVSIQQCSFTGNSANDDGDAIYLDRAFSGAAATITVNESIFGVSQTVFRRTGDSANSSLTITNSGIRQLDSGTDPIAGNNFAQSLGAPITNCPSTPNPCQLTVLPVEFLFMNKKCIDQQNVELSWSTATEYMNDYFTVFHSPNGIHWEPIKIISSVGNTQNQTNYSIQVPMRESGYFKLSQTDKNGRTAVLKMLFVENCADYSTIDAHYNLTNNSVNISYTFNKNEIIDLTVINSTGQLINSLNTIFPSKENSYEFKLPSDIASGLYFIMINSAVESKTVKIRVAR